MYVIFRLKELEKNNQNVKKDFIRIQWSIYVIYWVNCSFHGLSVFPFMVKLDVAWAESCEPSFPDFIITCNLYLKFSLERLVKGSSCTDCAVYFLNVLLGLSVFMAGRKKVKERNWKFMIVSHRSIAKRIWGCGVRGGKLGRIIWFPIHKLSKFPGLKLP